MKPLYFSIVVTVTMLLCSATPLVYAQAPQYSYTPNLITNNAIPLNSTSNLRQNLYFPSDFNAPSGNIDKIYIGGVATAPSFAPLTIKMGPTTLTAFTAGPYITGLTTVFSSNVSLSLVNGWYELILPAPYFYDNTQNLIIEVSQVGATGSGSSPCASNSAVPSTVNRTLFGSATATSGGLQARLMKMGFSMSPLSLELISFSAASREKEIYLHWKTANEKDISKFVVESSIGNANFRAIGEVQPKGGTSEYQEYSFVDANLQYAKAFYRLKIMETNGSFYYSSTIVANANPSGSDLLSIHPVPFRNELFATLTSDHGGLAQICIIDISGKRVIARQEFMNKGAQVVHIPGLAALSPGIYELLIEMNNKVYRKTVRK